MNPETAPATVAPEFTLDDLEQCWRYRDGYLLDILNGKYTVADAREDLASLVGSKYDPRVAQA